MQLLCHGGEWCNKGEDGGLEVRDKPPCMRTVLGVEALMTATRRHSTAIQDAGLCLTHLPAPGAIAAWRQVFFIGSMSPACDNVAVRVGR